MNYIEQLTNSINGLDKPILSPKPIKDDKIDYLIMFNEGIKEKSELNLEKEVIINDKSIQIQDCEQYDKDDMIKNIEEFEIQSDKLENDSISKHNTSEKNIVDNDMTKLSLLLSAVDLSASFISTSNSSNNNIITAESLKAAVSSAQIAKILAEELKLTKFGSNAISISNATVAITNLLNPPVVIPPVNPPISQPIIQPISQPVIQPINQPIVPPLINPSSALEDEMDLFSRIQMIKQKQYEEHQKAKLVSFEANKIINNIKKKK